jgi:hypothetical protein
MVAQHSRVLASRVSPRRAGQGEVLQETGQQKLAHNGAKRGGVRENKVRLAEGREGGPWKRRPRHAFGPHMPSLCRSADLPQTVARGPIAELSL